MVDQVTPHARFDKPYDKLVLQEETSLDEPLANSDKSQVTLSSLRPESAVDHHKLLVMGLAVLAVVLLAVDIGLGVYYNKLASGSRLIGDISSEISKLQAQYNTAMHTREDAKKQLAKVKSEHQFIKWELQHQTRRASDYETQLSKVQMEIASLRLRLPMIKEGCRHCLAGWIHINSKCYFFAQVKKPWQDARQSCRRLGADLIMIDSREKQRALSEIISSYKDFSRSFYQTGFWIGLRDIEEEGRWKWVDGTILTEGYWRDGEPNNSNHDEDCAAMYPNPNPFKSWNDAPCSYNLRWICEMML